MKLGTEMFVSFEVYVATRYLIARRKQAFISLISVISTLGVTLGVLALVVAVALMTGLQRELRDRIVGSAAHVYVWKVAEGGYQDYRAEAVLMSTVPHVVSAAPSIIGKALARTRSGEAFITVKGVDPKFEKEVTEVAQAVFQGSFFERNILDDSLLDGVVIGEGVAESLGVSVGGEITLVTPNGTLSPMGMISRPRRLQVIGIFSLGLYEYDNAYGFVTLDSAKRLLAEDQVQMMELRVDDIYASRQVAAAVEDNLGESYLTLDWSAMNESLFSALWLEKIAISGEISIAETIEMNQPINLTIFHAISGIGFQEHPLYEIESFTSDQLTFQHTFDYDAKGNRGLLIYAWVDLDGDGINCTPVSRTDLAGVAINEEFPKTNEVFQVEIKTSCVGPDWFYPGK